MHSLYPPIKPYYVHELPVAHPHVLYVEETGNPEGLPVIVLHPGPGLEVTPISGVFLIRRFIASFYLISVVAAAPLRILNLTTTPHSR